MYARLIQILLLILVAIIMFDGLPGLGVSIRNALPGQGHSSQYNLIFWIMILIGVFALLKRRNQGNNP